VLAELNGLCAFGEQGLLHCGHGWNHGTSSGAPRTKADWGWNNPKAAALEFVRTNPDFHVIEELPFSSMKDLLLKE